MTSARLRHLPVLMLTEPALLDIVLAGVHRAGDDPTCLTIRQTDRDTVRPALSGVHEVVIALCEASASDAVRGVMEVGGRPIVVLSLHGGDMGPIVSTASLTFLADRAFRDLEVPVPAVDDDGTRTMLWDQLRVVQAEDRHHLVEVDGRPALEGLSEHGTSTPADAWACLASGAAGVLAGRMAASNRRWRAQLDV